jgi:hypothetical protein
MENYIREQHKITLNSVVALLRSISESAEMQIL